MFVLLGIGIDTLFLSDVCATAVELDLSYNIVLGGGIPAEIARLSQLSKY